MNGLLKTGTTLTGLWNQEYVVGKFLGSGSQGEVYEVSDPGSNKLALKWYFKSNATEQQRKILDTLIKDNAPNDSFLWPADIVSQRQGKLFGYIMPLRPANYAGIVSMMKRKAEPTFEVLSRAAFALVKGYRALHTKGYCYRDISFGNVFFDPKSGKVLICDNDNVAPKDENCRVQGTPCFMAPEIVRGETGPSRQTDQFSLAVLLFYMFMLHHPLDGKIEDKIHCKDMAAQKKLYGTSPIFIFDPDNDKNRPASGRQDNAIIYWKLYPQEIKKLFIESFTVGLKEPNKRITENVWLDAICNLMCCIMPCSKCGVEVFADKDATATGSCWNCKTPIHKAAFITIGKNQVALLSTTKLYSHHVNNDYDISTVMGSTVRNPKNPNQWGIRNDSSGNWTYVNADGSQETVIPGKSAVIATGAKINFGRMTGEFK